MFADVAMMLTNGHSEGLATSHSCNKRDRPIFAVTSHERTRRLRALVWGIQSALVGGTGSTDGMIAASLPAALEQGVVRRGDLYRMSSNYQKVGSDFAHPSRPLCLPST